MRKVGCLASLPENHNTCYLGSFYEADAARDCQGNKELEDIYSKIPAIDCQLI
jgi:hypothetical protein